MLYLKQSTSVVISFGPFVSPSDGVTLVTSLVSALDNGSTGIFLSKNGGTLTIRHATVTASTYDAYGNYKVTLDTTDTNTLGNLRVQFAAAASCAPVWMDLTVLAANIYDSLIGGGANLKVDVDTIKTNPVVNGGTVTFTSNSTVASTTNITGGTITTVTNLTNAATAGDLTATMKTSVTSAVPTVANILTTQMTESYRANAAAPTLAQAACEILAHLGEASIAGTTKTIKKLDHSTSAETFTLDSATVPTSITRAT